MNHINGIIDYEHATGKFEYNMTNNYMFVAVLQEDKFALKGLVASLLHMQPEEIKDITILNPIIPGADIDLKEFILDVSLTFNDNHIVNLEMQVKNKGNWIPRSISYLCREWDRIEKGKDYELAPTAYQIGFLDFTLFKDHPEFYSTYRLRNTGDGYEYSDKFTLSVVELNHIDMATDEDRKYSIDRWARLFKSTTWEEVKMLASNDEYIMSAARSMYAKEMDEATLRLCRKTKEEIAGDEYRAQRLIELEKQISELETTASELEAKNSSLLDRYVSLETKNASLETENASLETKNASLETKNASLETKNASLETELNELRERIKQLENK